MSNLARSRDKVKSWIRDFPELQFDGTELYCKSCNKVLAWKVKANIKRHIVSENHKRCVSGTTSDSDRQSNLNLDLVEVMVGCNIPWAKLDNPLFRQFLQKCISGQYSNCQVPSETTLRKKYLSQGCDNIRRKISAELDGKYIWVSVDETINACGWDVANVLVGGLDENCSMRGHLITSTVLQTKNSSVIADVVHSSLRELWGDKYTESRDKLLLFVTSGVSDMKAAGILLKETYQNLLHMTCLAQGLQGIAETIRNCYPNIVKLISSVTRVFLKAPDRVRLFNEILPNVPLPPEPPLTQRGTWLQAASYYYNNFDGIKLILQQLNPDDSVVVSQALQAFMDPNAQENLKSVHENFSQIPLSIQELERKPKTTEFTTIDALNVIFNLQQFIFNLSGDIAEIVKEKFETVLENNPGFLTMARIVDLLNGKVDFSTKDINVASLPYYRYFKFAPVTSVSVEQSLPQYKWIFKERCQNLTPQHLEQILVIHFYSCEW